MADYNSVHGYICVPLCLIGIILNLLNAVVWSRQRRRTSMVIILIALSVADLLVVFSYFLFVVDFFLVESPTKRHHHSFIGMWLALIGFHVYILSTTWSNWIVVTLAIFRHVKVTRPNAAKIHCSKGRAKIALALLLIISFIIIVPNFFFYKIADINHSPNHTDYWIVKTDFSQSTVSYQRFLLWFSGIVMGLLPCFLLVGFTGSMIVAVARDRDERPSDFQSDRNRKTRMLLVILLMFLLAMLPIGIYAFVIAIDNSQNLEFFYFMKNLTASDIFYLLTIINSTSSFFVYLYFSRDFRRELSFIFRCYKCHRAQPGYTDIDDQSCTNTDIRNPTPLTAGQVAVQDDPFFK